MHRAKSLVFPRQTGKTFSSLTQFFLGGDPKIFKCGCLEVSTWVCCLSGTAQTFFADLNELVEGEMRDLLNEEKYLIDILL